MTRVAIHQPNYYPWIGYFAKIARADVFVLLDDVAYQSGNASSVTNRTRVKTARGPQILTVPVRHPLDIPIHEVEVDHRQRWRKKHLDTIRFAYSRSAFFAETMRMVEEVLGAEWDRLAVLNEKGIRLASGYLGLSTPLLLSSTLALESTEKNERILEICERVQARTYVSGAGARRYNDPKLFAERGVALEYTDFVCPEYPQLHGGFVPKLSIVDAMFNCGPAAARLLA